MQTLKVELSKLPLNHQADGMMAEASNILNDLANERIKSFYFTSPSFKQKSEFYTNFSGASASIGGTYLQSFKGLAKMLSKTILYEYPYLANRVKTPDFGSGSSTDDKDLVAVGTENRGDCAIFYLPMTSSVKMKEKSDRVISYSENWRKTLEENSGTLSYGSESFRTAGISDKDIFKSLYRYLRRINFMLSRGNINLVVREIKPYYRFSDVTISEGTLTVKAYIRIQIYTCTWFKSAEFSSYSDVQTLAVSGYVANPCKANLSGTGSFARSQVAQMAEKGESLPDPLSWLDYVEKFPKFMKTLYRRSSYAHKAFIIPNIEEA